MSLSPEERRQRKAEFHRLSPVQKAEYIYMYYKAPILAVVIALAVVLSGIWHAVTQKQPVLYLAGVNVSVGADCEQRLTTDYLRSTGHNPARETVQRYADLYLSDAPAAADHEYAYASRMKLLAAINAKQLDIVLMNREAYDLCSASGYLLDLTDWLDTAYLTENTIILDDNNVEYALEQAQEYVASTETVANAVELTALPAFRQTGFSDCVYAGVIANTPRAEECRRYLSYLVDD